MHSPGWVVWEDLRCCHHEAARCFCWSFESGKERDDPCINKVRLVYVFSCSNTGSIRNDPYWTSRKNSVELIKLSSIVVWLPVVVTPKERLETCI